MEGYKVDDSDPFASSEDTGNNLETTISESDALSDSDNDSHCDDDVRVIVLSSESEPSNDKRLLQKSTDRVI